MKMGLLLILPVLQMRGVSLLLAIRRMPMQLVLMGRVPLASIAVPVREDLIACGLERSAYLRTFLAQALEGVTGVPMASVVVPVRADLIA